MTASARPVADREWRLIQRAAHAADRDAFDVLVRPYIGRIRGYLGSLTYDDGDAEDLAQATLINAWRNLHRFDGSGRFVSWLFAIAHREFLQYLRKRKRYRRALDGLASETGAARVADEAANPLDLASREVVILARAVGLTQAEIAAALDKPLGTVKSLLLRATRRLLDEHGN